MFYLVRKPGWVRKLYGECVWDVPTRDQVIYLTFDDGPDPQETPFVLDALRGFNARATFFCIGGNVAAHPRLFQRLQNEGHSIGNHTWQHLDGWRTSNKNYYQDIVKAKSYITSSLFRPPYGHTTPFQVHHLKRREKLRTIMWSITSGDFDADTSPERCFRNVAANAYPGAIVLMHDSLQAAVNMRYALPRILSELSEKGYRFESLGQFEPSEIFKSNLNTVS